MEFDSMKAYTVLFNGITDAVRLIEDGEYELVKILLIQYQQQAEEEYIHSLPPLV